MNFLDIKIGHATDEVHYTGCTVFLCPAGTIGSVDIRGPAPGSREAALMQSVEKPIDKPNAVLLAGGSAFGLAAADGVMQYLAEQGIGHPTPVKPIPIVPAAIIYDLFFNGGERQPDREMGYAACENAVLNNPAQGNVGVGAGATVGKWGGFPGFMKGGFGLARMEVEDVIVCAAAVVNSVGDVVNEDGSVLAGARTPAGTWRAHDDPLRRFPERPPTLLTNTTLVVVATNVQMDKRLAHRLAQRAHDGLALAIRPVHTSHDGDTVFTLATCAVEGNHYDLAANMAVETTTAAIRNAVRHADTVGMVPGLASEIGR